VRALLEHKWAAYGEATFQHELRLYLAAVLAAFTALSILVAKNPGVAARGAAAAAVFGGESDAVVGAVLSLCALVALVSVRYAWRESLQLRHRVRSERKEAAKKRTTDADVHKAAKTKRKQKRATITPEDVQKLELERTKKIAKSSWWDARETRVWLRGASAHLADFWNLLEAASTASLLLSVALLVAGGGDGKACLATMSLAGFLAWFRVLIYLRGFESFGAIIRMIQQVRHHHETDTAACCRTFSHTCVFRSDRVRHARGALRHRHRRVRLRQRHAAPAQEQGRDQRAVHLGAHRHRR